MLISTTFYHQSKIQITGLLVLCSGLLVLCSGLLVLCSGLLVLCSEYKHTVQPRQAIEVNFSEFLNLVVFFFALLLLYIFDLKQDVDVIVHLPFL